MIDRVEPTDSGAAACAVVTVTYSPGELLDTFFTSLANAASMPLRVIVVDNGSVDGAPERAADNYEHVTLIHSGGNIGYGAAMNRGVAEIDSDTEFIILANPDVEWTPGAIDALLDCAHRFPRAGSVGPLICDADGTVYPSARAVPTLRSGIGHAVLGSVWKNNPWTREYRQSQDALDERTVGWLSGSCVLVRRSAFDSVNGFDSRYFMYMEDIDLGDRLGRAGWLNVFTPGAAIIHRKGHVADGLPALTIPAHHRSARRFVADRHPGLRWMPVRAVISAGLAVRQHIAVRAALGQQRRAR